MPASTPPAAFAAFAVSATLWLGGAYVAANRFGRSAGERFWIALAVAFLEVSGISTVLSFGHHLTPLAFLACQVVVTASLVWLGRRHSASSKHLRKRCVAMTPLQGGMLGLIVIVLASHVVAEARSRIHGFDDRMYRGARVAYWMQHRSLFPWDTANERQVSFAFGSELIFFWPLLMTRSEAAAHAVFALALPLCAIGFYFAARAGGARRTAATGGTLLLLVTPAVLRTGRGLSPEVWMALFALGTVFFALRARRRRGRGGRDLVLLGLFAALTAGVRVTGLALVAAVPIVPWTAGVHRRIRATALAGAGVVAGVVLGGLVIVFGTNLARHAHPLGSAEMRSWHMAEVSPRQMRTHVVRFVLALAELPYLPPPLREAMTRGGNALLVATGATAPLAGEAPGTWPGAYAYAAPPEASQFSIGGVFWLPALIVGVMLAIRDSVRRRRLRPAALATLLALPPLAGALLLVRWMPDVGRFWVPSYALGLVVVVLMTDRAALRWRWVGPVAAALVCFAAIPGIRDAVGAALREPVISPTFTDEPFTSALEHIPPGSTILLVAAGDAREYPLFAPREGFANRVIPWGSSPLDPNRMRALIGGDHVTHVLVERDDVVEINWGPSLQTAPIVAWLREQPDLQEIPIPTPHMRLFTKIAATK